MSLNSIGSFPFLDLKGNVELLAEQTRLIVRPGVAGSGVVLTGVRGEPFTLRSKVDAPSIAAAQFFYEEYLTYVGDGVFSVIHYGYSFAEDGYGFLVLKVKPAIVRANLMCLGGLNPPSLGWLECDWTLCCVALNQTGGNE